MKTKVSLFFLLNLMFVKVFSQTLPTQKYIEDKYAWYAGMSLGNAVGKYHTFLQEKDKTGSKIGLVVGGLMNPYKRQKASKVFFGGEFGIQSDGQDPVMSNLPDNFSVLNSSIWLNGMARYRPILWSSKINPFLDFFYGAKWIRTRIIRNLEENESELFEKYRKVVPNYGIGVGLGIKLTGQLSNKYLDIGLYYQQADATKIINRNSINISNDYVVTNEQTLMNTNQIILKLSICGFR